jgi:serine/threonine protein kinase
MANAGYVHLDVKPDNIVMGVPPRLIDLSLARNVEKAARSQGPIGTAAYQAPEQCGDNSAPAPIGPAADAWGLGATLFHALAGQKPFPKGNRDATGAARYRQLAEEPRPLPDHIPQAVTDLVFDLLDDDPKQRPSCAEAVERLEPVVASLPSRMAFSPRRALGV